MAMMMGEIPEVYLRVNRLDQIGYGDPQITDEASVAFTALSLVGTMLERTAGMQYSARRRDLRVGATAIAWRDTDCAIGQLTGANVTPTEQDATDIHAPLMAAAKARRLGFDRLLSLAVWGPPQPEDADPKSPTHHPCDNCRRELLDANTQPNTENMLLVTGNSDLSYTEVHALEVLGDYHLLPSASRPLLPAAFPPGQHFHNLFVGMAKQWAKLYPGHPSVPLVQAIPDLL